MSEENHGDYSQSMFAEKDSVTFDGRLDALKESVADCVVQTNCFRLPYRSMASSAA